MSLFRTELRRLAKRRFARWMTVGGLLVLAVVVAGMFLSNQKIGPDQWAEAERAADQQHQQQVYWAEQERANCERAKAAGERFYTTECDQISPPLREDFQAEWFLPSTFVFRDSFGEMLIPLAAILAMIGFVVGASFVGAEWSTGGMMNLLLWRPKRLTVLLTKLGALLTGLLALALPATVAWFGSMWLVADLRGSTERMTSGVWQSFLLTGLRGIVLALVAATVGFALASLGRHTAMALGGAIGVLVVGQVAIAMLLSMIQVRFLDAWLLPTYAYAWMTKQVELRDWRSCNASYTGECQPATLEITWQHSSALFTVGIVLVLGGAIWAMRRRDIN
ncbi:ABC transporter permease subunit [Micromonospora craniellae]|uniref:ABC transporter permease n=1 Tax=Micromonospora craniellae TaxID=2294034 RepID=A0A372FXI7_9ACTN|nr:ABC transporter permease subunit [Micromonospora craniellae]QOC90045.1 ABC transporter permease subunit [Micromonospora craniellae]RFS45246.1 ABC transporter permease [Micromonospora craniellae]